MVRKIEISYKTIFFVIFTLILLALVYKIADIILQLFVALLITAFLNPFVTNMTKYKIPKGISILLAYIGIIVILSFSVSAVVPPLAEQTTNFIVSLPQFLGNIGITSEISDRIVEQLVSQAGSVPREIAKATVSVFSNVLALVAVFVFSFYLLTERDKLIKSMESFVGEKKKNKIVGIVDQIEQKLGGWVRAQITLMFVVGVASFVGLTILGIPYALPLAIIAGLLEVVPYVGPFLSAIPAVIIGFGISPLMGFAAASVYFLVQQMENYLFVPKIMQKSAGIHPIVTLLALSIGFRLAGVVGLLLSVPVFITVKILASDYLSDRKR